MRLLVVAALWLLPVTTAAAQKPATGIGVAAGVVAGRDWFAGVGPGMALGVTRDVALSGAVLLGREAGRTEARAEVMWQYRVPAVPAARTRLYGAAGLGATTAEGRGPWLLVGVGLVRRAGSGAEWWAETGVGGGVRLIGGVRFRPGTQRRTAPGRGGP